MADPHERSPERRAVDEILSDGNWADYKDVVETASAVVSRKRAIAAVDQQDRRIAKHRGSTQTEFPATRARVARGKRQLVEDRIKQACRNGFYERSGDQIRRLR